LLDITFSVESYDYKCARNNYYVNTVLYPLSSGSGSGSGSYDSASSTGSPPHDSYAKRVILLGEPLRESLMWLCKLYSKRLCSLEAEFDLFRATLLI
jgi:hypothetical protein